MRILMGSRELQEIKLMSIKMKLLLKNKKFILPEVYGFHTKRLIPLIIGQTRSKLLSPPKH
jgi:hypothetical protein